MNNNNMNNNNNNCKFILRIYLRDHGYLRGKKYQ